MYKYKHTFLLNLSILQDYGEESEGLNIVQGYVKPEWVNLIVLVTEGFYKFWKPIITAAILEVLKISLD